MQIFNIIFIKYRKNLFLLTEGAVKIAGFILRNCLNLLRNILYKDIFQEFLGSFWLIPPSLVGRNVGIAPSSACGIISKIPLKIL